MKLDFEHGGLIVNVSEGSRDGRYLPEARAKLHTNDADTAIDVAYFPHDPNAGHATHEFVSLRVSVIGENDTPTGTMTLFCSVEQACKIRDELDAAIKQAPTPEA